MRYRQLKLSALFLLSMGCLLGQAQESVNASGAEVSGSEGSLSYSIGQPLYRSNSGTEGSVTQGVQQPYEISVVTGIDKHHDIKLQLLAYPNPTQDFLELQMENESWKHLSYRLYDIKGKLLQTGKLTASKTQIDMRAYQPSSYLIKIGLVSETSESQALKTFKIIKNK